MANDNETVEQVCEIVADLCSPDGGSFETIDGDRVYATLLADRILDAHKREIAAKEGERKGILKANESLAADNTRLRGELAAKDAEIARLNEQLVVHDCWADEECEDADAARTCAELETKELRALVKELSDIVDAPLCHQDCDKCPPDTRCASKRLRALVARAREVAK